MFVRCSPGSETKDKNLENILHEKSNHQFMVKKLPIKLKSYLKSYLLLNGDIFSLKTSICNTL